MRVGKAGLSGESSTSLSSSYILKPLSRGQARNNQFSDDSVYLASLRSLSSGSACESLRARKFSGVYSSILACILRISTKSAKVGSAWSPVFWCAGSVSGTISAALRAEGLSSGADALLCRASCEFSVGGCCEKTGDADQTCRPGSSVG